MTTAPKRPVSRPGSRHFGVLNLRTRSGLLVLLRSTVDVTGSAAANAMQGPHRALESEPDRCADSCATCSAPMRAGRRRRQDCGTDRGVALAEPSPISDTASRYSPPLNT